MESLYNFIVTMKYWTIMFNVCLFCCHNLWQYLKKLVSHFLWEKAIWYFVQLCAYNRHTANTKKSDICPGVFLRAIKMSTSGDIKMPNWFLEKTCKKGLKSKQVNITIKCCIFTLVYQSKTEKSEHHYWILHIRINLSTNFQLELTIASL